ncbi:MAG: Rpn family recombination-promoting nuclease/putative transposase [Ruminococcus sp.]|jgi:predicted transposase/invertase (TIGR01784 family)|nr:Rpn family recombination-promoting nuclease/putative transposase [Ruminococcus sp.]
MANKQEPTKLKHTMTDDVLFKMFFVKNPEYLKRVVGMILKTPLEAITEFEIINGEIPPEEIGDKFCRLDINMTVNGQKVDLEVQVADEGDYKKRSLYYWAREYSSALKSGNEYIDLPKVILISIVGFKMFDCEEFHSEFRPLEVTRHTELCDNQVMHYFELKKLPEPTDGDEEIKFWLAFFKAQTEEELEKIIQKGVPVMKEAVAAYKSVAVSPEFEQIERLRERTRHNEASAIGYAKREAAKAAAKATREEMTAEITKNLRALNMPDDFINKVLTGGA